MSLDIRIEQTLAAFSLNLSLSLEGPIVGVFGPSGAGKTTLLNCLAGLSRPKAGRIALGDDVWFDSTTRTFAPPHRRRIGYVFQEGRLFPHLSVRQNLLYGRVFARGAKQVVDFDQVVALLGLEALLLRRPRNLSGGEQQRVGIGRALLRNPRLILMDEPLAALDAARRREILPYIEQLRDAFGIPTVYVSHAYDEIERLADEIVLLEKGRVTELRRRERAPRPSFDARDRRG